MVEMSEGEFEEAVGDALDRVPEEFTACMDNVVFLVEEDSPPGQSLLGLYDGIPLTERDGWWATGALPDRITIFRRPILAICESSEEVIHQVAVTVIHEIAHHFGIDDERLEELGWV